MTSLIQWNNLVGLRSLRMCTKDIYWWDTPLQHRNKASRKLLFMPWTLYRWTIALWWKERLQNCINILILFSKTRYFIIVI